MNEKEMIEETKKELEKLPEVRCFDCENLCLLGDKTQICAVLSTKEGLIVIEEPKRKIKCPYYSPLPPDMIKELEEEEKKEAEEEELFDDDKEESLDDIDSLDKLLED